MREDEKIIKVLAENNGEICVPDMLHHLGKKASTTNKAALNVQLSRVKNNILHTKDDVIYLHKTFSIVDKLKENISFLKGMLIGIVIGFIVAFFLISSPIIVS